MKQFFFFLFFLLFLFASCTPQRDVSYFQDIDKYTNGLIDSGGVYFSTKIKVDDELIINISSVDPRAVSDFNVQSFKPTTGGSSSVIKKAYTDPTNYQSIYLVDRSGYVHLPTLGKISLVGLSLDEAAVVLQDKLKEHIKDPIVDISISNFKVLVLGEVAQPGTYLLSGQKVSVLDALASAKDITIFGRRDNVLLIRDNDGKKEYIKFDLTKSDILASSNFYLQQNDVLYISPTKQKQYEAGIWQQRQFNLSIITASVSSAISVITLILLR